MCRPWTAVLCRGRTFDSNMRPKEGVAATRHLWGVCAVLFCVCAQQGACLAADEGSGLEPWQLTPSPADESDSTNQSDPPVDRGSGDPLSSLNLTIISVVLIVGVVIVTVAGCAVCGLCWLCRHGNRGTVDGIGSYPPATVTIIQNPAPDPFLASGSCTTDIDPTTPCPIHRTYHTIHTSTPSSGHSSSSLPTVFDQASKWAPSGVKARSQGELNDVIPNQSAIDSDLVQQVTPL